MTPIKLPGAPLASNLDVCTATSGSAILFVGGIKPVISMDVACPPREFATEPFVAPTPACLRHSLFFQDVRSRRVADRGVGNTSDRRR
jgi:hypothetical protein